MPYMSSGDITTKSAYDNVGGGCGGPPPHDVGVGADNGNNVAPKSITRVKTYRLNS